MTRRAAARLAALSLALAAAVAASAAADDREMIGLPSGGRAYLQERLEDRLGETGAGETGLTYRYRYVMPDLAERVPSTYGPASEIPIDGVPDAPDRAPLDIDTEAAGEGDPEDYIDDGMIDPEEFDFAPVITIPGTEEAADAVIDHSLAGDDGEALPAAPESVFRDPVHDDIIWLCEHRILPDVLAQARSGGQRPGQVIISLADRESRFGSYDPEVLQIFEAFSIPADRDICEWRPW